VLEEETIYCKIMEPTRCWQTGMMYLYNPHLRSATTCSEHELAKGQGNFNVIM
jgi:hypothetical protein